MQRTKRAVAEQLLQPRGLEDAVRAAERQRRAGDAAYRLADHVFRPVECGGRFCSRPFLVAEPGRTVCDQPCRFEIGAHLGDVTAYVGVVGERLGIAFRLARTDDPAQLVKRGLRDPEIDRGVRAPEPVQIGVAEGSQIVRAEDRSAFRHPTSVEYQRVAAGRAHTQHVPVWIDAAPLSQARQHQDDPG